MNDAQRQKILEHLNQIKKNIEDIKPHIDHIDGTSKYLTNAGFDVLTVCELVKKSNDKEENGDAHVN